MLLSSSSCSTTEEIWIDKNGAVRRELTMDVGLFGMIAGMKDQFEDQFADSTYLSEDFYSDSTEMIVDRQVKRPQSSEADSVEENTTNDNVAMSFLELFERESLDTILNMKDFLLAMGQNNDVTPETFIEELENDTSINEEERAAIKTLATMKLRLRVNKSQNLYAITIMQDFKNQKELDAGMDFSSLMRQMMSGQLPSDAESNEMFEMMMGNSPVYDLKKGEFRIRKPATDMSAIMENLGPAAGMIGGTYLDYKYIIHVPQKVKSINHSEAQINGNTIILDAPVKLGSSKAFDLIIKYK
ncbi:MAG: hypothetical protein HC892_03805 [Saprospiraceae bacterium]|nr:hypothetical protein [Saprospiraceae bacterium]